jgi:hypothetical protein
MIYVDGAWLFSSIAVKGIEKGLNPFVYWLNRILNTKPPPSLAVELLGLCLPCLAFNVDASGGSVGCFFPGSRKQANLAVCKFNHFPFWICYFF